MFNGQNHRSKESVDEDAEEEEQDLPSVPSSDNDDMRQFDTEVLDF